MIRIKGKNKAIFYFLEVILNKNYPLETRKEEMLKTGSKLCQGFPSWSDFFGVEMKPIDNISKDELRVLLDDLKKESIHDIRR